MQLIATPTAGASQGPTRTTTFPRKRSTQLCEASPRELPRRDRHAEAARRWHPPGALEFRAARLRTGLTGWAAAEGYGSAGGTGEYEGVWQMAYIRGPEGTIVSLAQRTS